MSKATFKGVLSMVALAALTACGGGGGSSEAPAKVTVAGTAAKGLLAFAKVSVYEIGPTGPDYSKPLATGITRDDGSYSLNIRPTDNPILVKVESVAGTKMLDETQIVNGEFKQVDVPVGLVLRSVAPNASNGTVNVSANPFTDAAVAAAETATGGAWSADAIAGGIQLAAQLVPAGVDPFKTTATNLTQVATNSAAQNDLLVALTGFMQKAQSCVDDGPTVTLADIRCEQKMLNDLTGLKVTTGGSSLTQAAALSSYRTAQYDAAKAATSGKPLQTQAGTIAASYGTGGTATSIVAEQENASTLAAKSALTSFVNTLRQGFVQSEQTLKQAVDGFDARYQNMASDGARAVIDAADIVNGCLFDNNTFVCDAPGWMPATGGGYTKTIPSSRVPGATVVVTANATYSDSAGYGVAYKAIQASSAGKTLSSADLAVGLTGFDSTVSPVGNSVGVTVNGNFRAYDTGPSGAYATLSFDNIRFSAVEGTPNVMKAAGGVTLSSSLGDKLAGTLDLEVKEKELSSFDTTGELTKLILSLKAEAAPNPATQYAALGIVANASQKDFSGLGYDSYSLAANVELTNLTKLGLNVSRAAANVVNATATIGSNGSVVILSVKADSAIGKYCFPADGGAKLCGNELKISAKDGAYTAVLKNGASSGDILSNGVKVGTISRSGIKVDGQEYSFY